MADPTFDDILGLAQQLSAGDRRRLIDELSASAPQYSATSIIEMLNHHADDLKRLGVASIGLFGSYLRGEARLDSDIDLLVKMADPKYAYFDLFAVQGYLEKLFNAKINLAPEDALKPAIRREIKGAIYAEAVEQLNGGLSGEYSRSQSRWPYVKKVRGRRKAR